MDNPTSRLTAEQQKELAHFPPALRALIEAELAAGNFIAELGYTHPASPAGAYFKLTKQITTRARATDGGLDFYERNGSSYSGQFTDAKRLYFVLEPPNPPPPEPDMDAIRRAHEPWPGDSPQYSQVREPLSGARLRRSTLPKPKTKAAAWRGLALTETATGAERVLHFCDQRPPHEVQFALELRLMTLFTPALADGRWGASAIANVNGDLFDFELRFVAALPADNYYSLRATTSWATAVAANHDYHRKLAASWFERWTDDLTGANPPGDGAGSEALYQSLSAAALTAEAHLDSVAAIQQAIVAGLKRGGRYAQTDKENDTIIFWRTDRFVRIRSGDDPDDQQFTDEAKFLKMLRQYYQMNVTSRAGKETISELDAWRLILRCLDEAN